MAQRRKHKLDGIDHEHITHVLESRGWQLIRQRLERALRLKIEELVAPHSEADTATIRGFINGLKTALDVPQILMREAAANRGEENNDGDGAPGI